MIIFMIKTKMADERGWTAVSLTVSLL